MTRTIYEEIGGQHAVNNLVSLFYRRVLMDPRIYHFFKDADIERIKNHQAAFLAHVLGGPNPYEGVDLRKAHKNLVEKQGLSDEHFDAVAEHLASVLQDLGLLPDLQNQVMDIVASTRNDVLGR